jgi:hypothetical protein
MSRFLRQHKYINYRGFFTMKPTDFINEDFVTDAHEAHQDHEVQMARSDCYSAAKYAIELHKLLKNVSEQQGLDGWVSEKITLANDYLRTVHEYLTYEQMSQANSMPGFDPQVAEMQIESIVREAQSQEIRNKKGTLLGTWDGRTFTMDPGLEQQWTEENGPEWIEAFKNKKTADLQQQSAPSQDSIKYYANELEKSDGVVQQIIRPTGLVDPKVVVKPSKGQIDDLTEEIRIRVEKDERVLVTTLTKRLAEEVTDYFTELGIRVRYLHSDVDTLRRVELLRELRQGLFDVLVGINLLREGLDLPEVSLVAILDADKEGFLRSSTSLIQTIGRAARNVNGEVHMYADKVTDSMARAIEETNRRREIQVAYNVANGVDPQPLRKKIADITDALMREEVDTEALIEQLKKEPARKGGSTPMRGRKNIGAQGKDQLLGTILELDAQMKQAARDLQFELAARIRDEIGELKKELRQIESAGHA